MSSATLFHKQNTSVSREPLIKLREVTGEIMATNSPLVVFLRWKNTLLMF